MSRYDLTVALTAHSETVIAGPTMRSAEAAISTAETEGLRVERLIGFDAAKENTRAYFAQSAFAEWRTAEFDFCDQGQTRNALVEKAAGRWVALLDGDDLFSENWLVEAARLLRQADEKNEKIVVHPELNWGFDGHHFGFVKLAQDDPLFSPYYFYIANYYDALCVAPRNAWLENPYADRAIAEGFAYEDWQWGIETMAAGWRHVIAKNTIIFKRRRDSSQTVESSRNRALIRTIDPLAIDRVAGLNATPGIWKDTP